MRFSASSFAQNPAITARPQRIIQQRRAEADNLISQLPKHLEAMCEFNLQTGLRRTNVTHLEWSQVDLVRKTAWILSEQTKNGKALAVPLSDKAMDILEGWRGKHLRWVFPKAEKPVKQTSTKAWRNALTKTGIDDFCWHDLRHTWASWHVQNGTPLHVLQELGGWSSIKMVQPVCSSIQRTLASMGWTSSASAGDNQCRSDGRFAS